MPIATGTALLASAAISAGAGAIQANQAKKAMQGAANSSRIDINALDNQTREIAKKNALDSAALEQQLTPEVPKLRTAANNAVLNGIGGNADQANMANFVMSRFGQPVSNAQFNQVGIPELQRTDALGAASYNTPLLNDAIAKARADLGLGGQLSLDQRNEATRRGATASGNVSGRLGLGRDLSARDLGMTSYQVEQQRLQNAANISPLELNRENAIESARQNVANFNLQRNLGESNYGLNAAQLGFNQNLAGAQFNLSRDQANNNNYLNQFGALNSYYNNLRQQDLAAAQYGQSIAQPITGLDPSAVANLAVGNSNNQTQAAMNAASIKAQTGQNLMGFGGQLLGYGLMGGFGGQTAGAQQGLPQAFPTGQYPTATATVGSRIFG